MKLDDFINRNYKTRWPVNQQDKAKIRHCCQQDDSVKTKIQQTNDLIEKLQKTLDQIRYRTKIPEEATTTDASESEENIDVQSKCPCEEKTAEVSSEESAEESDEISIREKISQEDLDDVDESSRPKTRRCGCIEKASSSDKFKTTSVKEVEPLFDDHMDEFDILQAKLNSIVELSESDDKSSVSKTKTEKPGVIDRGVGPEDSTMIVEEPTTISCTCQTKRTHQLSCFRRVTNSFEICPCDKRTLSVQILPPIVIQKRPTVRKIMNFFIDPRGITHISYKDGGANIGFFEIQSSSLTEVYTARDYPRESISKERALNEEFESDKASIHPNALCCGEFKQNPHRGKSVSESGMNLKKAEKSTDSQPTYDKGQVLKSYQLYDYKNHHDPGELNAHSFEVISTIDEQVYKTFINPHGFSPPPFTQSVQTSTHKPKPVLDKLASMKSLLKQTESEIIPPKTKKEYEKSSQDFPEDSDDFYPEDKNGDKSPEGAHKLFNIGLYQSKSTQMSPHQEAPREAKKEYDKNIGRPVDSPQIVVASNDIRSFGSYEKISLTISYSTEESITTESSANGIQQKNENIKKFTIDDKSGSANEVRRTVSFGKRGRSDEKTFRSLREKITREHSLGVEKSTMEFYAGSDSFDEDEMVGDSSVAVPNFISGLLESEPNDVRRVIPLIRRSVRVAKSEHRHSAASNRKTSVRLEDEDEEEEVSNHRYTAHPVQIQGDHVSAIRQFEKLPDFANASPLRIGKNGRYKDEENMFCESNAPKYENLLHKKFGNVSRDPYNSNLNLDSSNSDTITHTDRITSEGEVRCECSVSIGEMHPCKARGRFSSSRFKGQRPLVAEEHVFPFRRRRTYFNNWITYYMNRNVVSLNDSSSTSKCSVLFDLEYRVDLT
ncbi:hypothetical protein JTB14_032629 [Gonioctena quinquepunctata]|nr:hypothetical protein JTB14_032629 [Gonioctena quinquepunctata]